MLPTFISCAEVMQLTGCKASKAYGIIRTLNSELKDRGFLTPGQGRVSSEYFCTRLHIDPNSVTLPVKEEARA